MCVCVRVCFCSESLGTLNEFLGAFYTPAAAFCKVNAWICGVTEAIFPSEMMDESSLVISKLSFMFGCVIPPLFVLHFVFRFAILGGNFIFNFLLFSYEKEHTFSIPLYPTPKKDSTS